MDEHGIGNSVVACEAGRSAEDEWLWGWDPTPGIVSVWAEGDGRAIVWRRIAETGELVCEEARFRPWLLLDRLDDLRHFGSRLEHDEGLPAEARSTKAGARVSYRELDGPGTLRYLVSADDGKTLRLAVLQGATRRLGRHVGHLWELGKETVLALPTNCRSSHRRSQRCAPSSVNSRKRSDA
jgi:DNA polymerase I